MTDARGTRSNQWRALEGRGRTLPTYSSGPHGLETVIQAHLRCRLEPLLTDMAHGAQVYRAGHEHLFEVTPPLRQGHRCSPDQGGVMHMTSGAADA